MACKKPKKGVVKCNAHAFIIDDCLYFQFNSINLIFN